MIEIEEAIETIKNNTRTAESVTCSLENALGKILAKDVVSPMNMPPFRQSSMDGYALKYGEIDVYEVIGEVAAGKSEDVALKPGQAVRIFTGARVPDKADRVVMQEHTSVLANKLTVEKMPLAGVNIRPAGEQLKKNSVALPAGTCITEAGIGFLSGLGLKEVEVYKTPTVGILVTGNELQEPGVPLEEGQVYESNSITLRMALKSMGITQVRCDRVADNLDETTQAIKNLLKECDVILISGGISVGDYDFVRESLLKNTVQELFYKVNQKPGKPLWYGRLQDKQVFALPGNPGSSLTCFYVYVRLALNKMRGISNNYLENKTAVLSQDVTNTFGKVLFLKATVHGEEAIPLGGQASSMLQSFAQSNALLVIPANVQHLEKGTTVKYIAL